VGAESALFVVEQPDILIIGAGITGLTAAAELAALGKNVLVLDKGRSVGGRLATRRVGEGIADTGAQFFTTRAPEFEAKVAEWVAEGLVFEWSRGWSDGSLATVREGHPRYAVRGGMNQLAKRLAQGVPVRLLQVITTIRRVPGGWQVELANGESQTARALLLTPPVPQSLELLDEGGVALPFDAREGLNKVDYDPCVVGLFTLSRPIDLPSPGAVQRPHANLFWVADNQRKGISPHAIVLTAQASPNYSRALWSADDDTIIKSMKLDLMPFLGERTSVLGAEVKRWRYAAPNRLYPEPALLARVPLTEHDVAPLAFAGDGFGAARVEGAYLSGLAAARALAEATA
jgi:predicted NAD/FAD-dependent oxidoreductase